MKLGLSINVLVAALILLAAGVIMAEEQVDSSFGDLNLDSSKKLLLRLPFDGTSAPTQTEGVIKKKKDTISEYIEGRKKRKAAVISKDSMVSFNWLDNKLSKSGTLMFWVKPLNWSGSSPLAEAFISLYGDAKGKDPHGSMVLYANSHKKKALVVSCSRKTGFAEPVKGVSKVGGLANINNWKTNEWRHVVFTWNKQRMCLYIDGQKKSKINSTIYLLPSGFTRLIIGGCWNWCGKRGDNKSAIQDLMIFEQALSPNEIKGIFKGRPFELSSEGAEKTMPLVEAPYSSISPKIDGNLTDAAWQKANSLIGFVNNTTRTYAEKQTEIALLYNAKGLYIGFKSPVIASTVPAKDFYQVILNPPGKTDPVNYKILYDGKVVDAKGKSVPVSQVSCRTRVTGKYWIAEIYISFAALGVLPPENKEEWNVNFCRKLGSAHTSWVSRWNPDSVSIPENEYGRLIFTNKGPTLQLVSLGDLKSRDFSVDMKFMDSKSSGQIFYFVDTIEDGNITRCCFTEKEASGQFGRMKIYSGLPGSTSFKTMEWVTLSAVDQKFKKVFFRSDRLPVGIPAPVQIIKTSLEKTLQCLKVVMNMSGLKPALLGKVKLTATLKLDGKKVKSISSSEITGPRNTIEFPFKNLTMGKKYLVAVVLQDRSGKIIGSSQKTFAYPDASKWLNNKLGVSDKVPTPWSPVKTIGTSIECWGRKYEFSKGNGFPEQIITRDKAILAGPIRLEALVNGEKILFKQKSGEIVSNSKNAAVFAARGHGADINVDYKTTVEYDGMLRTDFTITPLKQKLNLDKLRMVIPLKKEYAEYLGVTESVGAGQHSFHYYGNLPENGYSCPFMPFVWLGDNDRGLLWFCQSARNWSRQDLDKVICIERKKDKVNLIIDIISKPVKLTKKLDYTIGLQASPVRPLPKGWRKLENKWVFGPTDAKYFAYVPKASERWSAKFKKAKAQKKLISAYSFLNNVSTKIPEYNLFFDEWKRHANSKKGVYYMDVVSPTVKSWQDFIVWSYVEGMNKFDIDGIYYDLAWPSPTRNPIHGGYVNEYGKSDRFWPIFAVREIAKRSYIAFRNQKPQTAFIGHCSSNPIVLPIMSFCDFALDGEQFGGNLHSYMEQIPLDKMRAEFTCRQFGLIPLFLPEIGRSGNKDYSSKQTAPTEEMVALFYLHDVMIWPIWVHHPTLAKYQKAKMAFIQSGDKKIDFIPYWDNPVAKSSNNQVKISAYRKNDANEAFLMISNLSDSPVSEDLTVNLKQLGFGAKKVVCMNAVTGKILPNINGKIKVNIAGKSLLMVTLKLK
jgi:Glycoside hydrolase 123, N-terminal domain/Concanavalin A-like lectin/glucanases superfamily